MKDLSEADTILDITIIYTSDSICLPQSHYTQMVIHKFGYSDYSSVPTHDPSIHLLKEYRKICKPRKVCSDY